jgi:hypothetical protein
MCRVPYDATVKARVYFLEQWRDTVVEDPPPCQLRIPFLDPERESWNLFVAVRVAVEHDLAVYA